MRTQPQGGTRGETFRERENINLHCRMKPPGVLVGRSKGKTKSKLVFEEKGGSPPPKSRGRNGKKTGSVLSKEKKMWTFLRNKTSTIRARPGKGGKQEKQLSYLEKKKI